MFTFTKLASALRPARPEVPAPASHGLGEIKLVAAERLPYGLAAYDVPAEGIALTDGCSAPGQRVVGTLEAWMPHGSPLPSYLLVDGVALACDGMGGHVEVGHGLWEVRRPGAPAHTLASY